MQYLKLAVNNSSKISRGFWVILTVANLISFVKSKSFRAENNTAYQPVTIQAAILNARKIFADLATILLIEMFILVVCPL